MTFVERLGAVDGAVKKNRCRKCGGPQAAIVQVRVHERPSRANGNTGGTGKHIVSRSMTLCEDCTVTTWERFVAAIDEGT